LAEDVSRETFIRRGDNGGARFHVKHLDADQSFELLAQWSAGIGVELSLDQTTLLLQHLDWLLGANLTLNLTSVSDPTEALRLHVVDSLTAAPEVIAAAPGKLLDIGTGGGFPGVPLAVATGRTPVLMDSVKKKADALAGFLERHLPEAVVVPQRAEDFAVSGPGQFGVVVARAVAQLNSLVELAAPLLGAGGSLVCLKGRPDDEEISRGEACARIVGLEQFGVRTLELPVGGEVRTIVHYRRTGDSSVPLPRRVGRAQKRPLA
jgi:16S rRNA (guanine527-N7)-methyltransferase